MDSKKTFAQTNLPIRIAIGTQGFYFAPSIVVTLQNQYIDTLKSIRFQMFFFCFHYKKQVCGGDVDCLFSITHRRHRRPHQPVSSHSKIRPFRRWRRWWVNILQIIAVVRDIELEHTHIWDSYIGGGCGDGGGEPVTQTSHSVTSPK